MRPILILAATLAASPMPAASAMLRPFSPISTDTVHLGDLFSDLGNTPDRVLGAAPAPGARVIVPSTQLAAIARDFGVDWRPQSGSEQVVVERRCYPLPTSQVMQALRLALQEAGAPPDIDVATPGFEPVLIPAGSHAEPHVNQLSYDAPSGRFTALISVAIEGAPEAQLRLSGQAIAMQQALVATRRLTHGGLITPADIRPARVRTALLRNSAVPAMQDAVGLSLRHDVQAGQILTNADLTHPALVERGSLVHMSLDSDGLSLSAQGIAKEEGAAGARIHVENPLSHQVVVAEVTGVGEVRVAPRAAVIALVSTQ
jgi:flagella basal body P-ring formation protein FlgA